MARQLLVVAFENVKVKILRGSPPFIEVPVCELCGAVVVEDTIPKHAQFHIDQEDRLKNV